MDSVGEKDTINMKSTGQETLVSCTKKTCQVFLNIEEQKHYMDTTPWAINPPKTADVYDHKVAG